jgi:hypothetical protein
LQELQSNGYMINFVKRTKPAHYKTRVVRTINTAVTLEWYMIMMLISKGLDNQKQVTNNNRAYSLEIIHLDSGNKKRSETRIKSSLIINTQR